MGGGMYDVQLMYKMCTPWKVHILNPEWRFGSDDYHPFQTGDVQVPC